MKPSHAFFYIILLAIVLLSAFVLFEHQKKAVKNSEIGEPTPPVKTSSSLPPNQISRRSNAPYSRSPNALSSAGKILSDIATSSNRVVIAEKDGVQKTAYIPLTMANALTSEQILDSLFHTNSPPRPSDHKLIQHLTFYGLTVDDQTNVLGGVTISGSVLVIDGKNPGYQLPVETTSDVGGRFQFDVDYGQEIGIHVSKGTKYISPPPQSFCYGDGSYGPRDSVLISNPNIADPVVFVLTKKKEPEPLIEIRKGMTAPNTGEPVRIDLTTGEVVPTRGDLIVSITCLEPYKAGVQIPWKLVLQATGGGFVTKSLGQATYVLGNMLEAPESGYDEIVIDHPKDDPSWDSQYDATLFLKSRSGQIYGKLTFDMHTQWDERGVMFRFHSFVNTNASRNLQGMSR